MNQMKLVLNLLQCEWWIVEWFFESYINLNFSKNYIENSQSIWIMFSELNLAKSSATLKT